MSTEESKQIGYPLNPASAERISTFSIDDSLHSTGSAIFTKQESINWHLMHTNQNQMIDS